MTTLFAIGSTEIIFIIIVVFLIFLIPIIALIDILKSKFEGNSKLIWIILVVFTSLIGTLLYFTIGKNQKLKV